MAVQLPIRKAPPTPPQTPAESRKGWWNIKDLIGTREKVLAAIAANASVPDWGKAMLNAAIAARPADLNLFYIDAHFMCGNRAGLDNATLHLTVQGQKAAV